MHTDEAVNAYIVGQLLAHEPFRYDPRDRHGPLLAAIALPLAKMQGAKSFSDLTESELRLTSVLGGTVIILLFGAAVDMFGFAPCAIAALLFAGCALPVYYDRYFIHESLFVAMTFAFLMCVWRASRTDSHLYAALAGSCAAFMLAAKETAILHFAALAAAAAVYLLWNVRSHRPARLPRPKFVVAAIAAFLLVSVLLFTWFGTNWSALAALAHAIPNLLARSQGQGHEKPLWYFAQLLAGGRSGGFLLALACIGFVLAVRKRDASLFAFLAYYALFLFAIYSLIPYKTPWLALNLWLPLALFAARAVVALWQIAQKHLRLSTSIPAFGILALIAAALIARDTRQRVFVDPAGETNPYAYTHTSEDLLGLPDEIATLARQYAIASPRIAVIAADSWPLPWYLRHYTQVGFWQPGQQVGNADFYVTSTEAADRYKDQLRDFRPEFFGARPGVLVLLWSPAPK